MDRLSLAKRFLSEALEYLRKGDSIQASEKMYKAVEECIKALAEKLSIPKYLEAVKEGRWYTDMLSKAAKTLSKKLNAPFINIGWGVAHDLHVWSFHEAKLGVEYVEAVVPIIKQFIEECKKIVSKSYKDYVN